jgi:hypothetical protein
VRGCPAQAGGGGWGGAGPSQQKINALLVSSVPACPITSARPTTAVIFSPTALPRSQGRQQRAARPPGRLMREGGGGRLGAPPLGWLV